LGLKRKLVKPTLWTEIVGIFHELSSNGSYTYVKIGNNIIFFPKESLESKIVHNRLCRKLIGQKIGLLRCDEPNTPVLIRVINRRSGTIPKINIPEIVNLPKEANVEAASSSQPTRKTFDKKNYAHQKRVAEYLETQVNGTQQSISKNSLPPKKHARRLPADQKANRKESL
jgi:hypothetical protein